MTAPYPTSSCSGSGSGDAGRHTDAHEAVLDTARAAGAGPAELAALRHRLDQLDRPGAGLYPGAELDPVPDPPHRDDLPEPGPEAARAVLDRLVVVRLNGGLGTTMGLSGPKSLVPVRPGTSFLDVLARQVLALRARHGARLPLLLMHSATTRGPALAALRHHPGLWDQPTPPDFLQGRVPRLRAADHRPVTWPADPDLEWCPPGHGDLYPALAATGTLDALLAAGLRWAFVANADNLGARPDVRIAAWVAAERVPFAMEVVRGTAADRKGGHLARRRADPTGRVVLRETAQVPDGDPSFTDVERWRWYNTNNLWLDLEVLRDLQAADPAAPALPLVVNRRTVDPRDPASTPVLQLESAMGAAIGSVPGARAVAVPRTRFAPVKTTDDLLLVRSDAYDLAPDGALVPAGPRPLVTLDPRRFGLLADLDRRFPAGPPSLRGCRRFTVTGDVTFGADVVAAGDVTVTGPRHVPDGTVLRG